MELFARQGDLVFERSALSGEFTPESNVVLAGRDSAAHTIRGKVEVRREGLRTLVRVGAKAVTVDHDGRHKSVTLPAKWEGEVRPLRERGSGEDRAVED